MSEDNLEVIPHTYPSFIFKTIGKCSDCGKIIIEGDDYSQEENLYLCPNCKGIEREY